MSTVSTSTGLVSGLNITQLVDAYINAERGGARRLESRLAGLTATQTGLTTLQATLVSLTTSGQTLSDRNTFRGIAVRNSDSAQISINTRPSAVAGDHKFQVLQRSSSQTSASKGFVNDQQTIGAGQIVVSSGGFIDRSSKLETYNNGAGVRRGTIRVSDRAGRTADIDLKAAVTTRDVVDAINNASGITVRASTLNDRLVLTDTSGQSITNLSITDVGTGRTAADLGIAQSVAHGTLTGQSVYRVGANFGLSLLNDGNGARLNTSGDDLKFTLQDGSEINVNLDGAGTLGDVVSKINTATGASGKLSADIQNDRLVLTDATTGTSTFSVVDGVGADVVSALGLNRTSTAGVLTGARLTGGVNSVLLQNLRGGRGITQLGEISLTDRSGATSTINLSTAETLDDVLHAINTAVDGSGQPLKLSAKVNNQGTGLIVTDSSGGSGPLTIQDVAGGTTAADLGIAISANQSETSSGNLGLRYVNETTRLSGYSPRNGAVSNGSFQITDSAGGTTVVNITGTARTLGDVIDRINASNGANVRAELNDTGDGFKLVDLAAGTGTLAVAEVGGRTAADLRLLGASTVGNDGKQQVSSRLATIIDIAATDNIVGISNKINAPGGAIRANILSTGGSLNATRLQVRTTVGGSNGRFAVEESGISLGFSVQNKATDAILRVGDQPETAYVTTSSNNTFVNVLPSIDVTANAVGTQAAQVTLSTDTDKTSSAIRSFVESYNRYVDQAASLTRFDSPGARTNGPLVGSTTVVRISAKLTQLVGRSFGPATSSIRSLGDVGIRLDGKGKLQIDDQKLDDAVSQHGDDVNRLFTDTATGIGPALKTAIDELTNDATGSLTRETRALQTTSDGLRTKIVEIDARLAVRRSRLQRQFFNVENILGELQGQQQAIAAFTNSNNSKK